MEDREESSAAIQRVVDRITSEHREKEPAQASFWTRLFLPFLRRRDSPQALSDPLDRLAALIDRLLESSPEIQWDAWRAVGMIDAEPLAEAAWLCSNGANALDRSRTLLLEQRGSVEALIARERTRINQIATGLDVTLPVLSRAEANRLHRDLGIREQIKTALERVAAEFEQNTEKLPVLLKMGRSILEIARVGDVPGVSQIRSYREPEIQREDQAAQSVVKSAVLLMEGNKSIEQAMMAARELLQSLPEASND